jgi:hypothetical protein
VISGIPYRHIGDAFPGLSGGILGQCSRPVYTPKLGNLGLPADVMPMTASDSEKPRVWILIAVCADAAGPLTVEDRCRTNQQLGFHGSSQADPRPLRGSGPPRRPGGQGRDIGGGASCGWRIRRLSSQLSIAAVTALAKRSACHNSCSGVSSLVAAAKNAHTSSWDRSHQSSTPLAPPWWNVPAGCVGK